MAVPSNPFHQCPITASKVNRLCEQGHAEGALPILAQRGIPLSRNNAYYLLRGCLEKEDLAHGRQLQSLMLQNDLGSFSVLDDLFIRLFSSCGDLVETNRVFNKVRSPSFYTWTAVISANTNGGQMDGALQLYNRMRISVGSSNTYAYLAALKACTLSSFITGGRLIHAYILQDNLQSDIFLGSTLIDMYSKCGCLGEAHISFKQLHNPNVVAWGAMMAGYARHDEGLLMLECFSGMQKEGIKPNKVIFLSLLKACSSTRRIEIGRHAHEQIIESELQFDDHLGSTIVDMYAKCGNLDEARRNFDKLPTHDVVKWGAMIAGYAQHGEDHSALECFDDMKDDGLQPDNITISIILKVCGIVMAIDKGRDIHREIAENGFPIIVWNALIDMYIKCRSLEEACSVFDKLNNRDIFSWGTMIAGFACEGYNVLALEISYKMQDEGLNADKVTFLSSLKACSNIGAIGQGRNIHEQIMQSGLQSDIVVGNTLIDMYAKCGSLEEAVVVFDKLLLRDMVSWSTIINGYVQNGKCLVAVECYENMLHEGMKSNKTASSSVLKACSNMGIVQLGRCIHGQIIGTECLFDLVIGNSLVDMYVKCGSLEEAHDVFDKLQERDVVSWGAIIMGLVHQNENVAALEYFDNMYQESIKPNAIIFSSILKACASICILGHGRSIHEQIVSMGIELDHFVKGSLIDMYAKCGSFQEACRMFDKVWKQDVVSWGAMIAGYIDHGRSFLALESFNCMKQEEIRPDKATFQSVLKACASSGTLEQGRHLHEEIIEAKLQSNNSIGISLINMYISCGSLQEAESVFKELLTPCLKSWNAIISGYAQFGYVEEVIFCIAEMQYDGIEADDMTFIWLFSACSHRCSLDEGLLYFEVMAECYGTVPNMFHYNCIIDLLGRAGCFDEAEDFFKNKIFQNKVESGASGWMAVLDACSELEIGRQWFGEIY